MAENRMKDKVAIVTGAAPRGDGLGNQSRGPRNVPGVQHGDRTGGLRDARHFVIMGQDRGCTGFTRGSDVLAAIALLASPSDEERPRRHGP